MKAAPLCPRCGARLATTALGGLCPRCVGRGLLRAEPAVQVPGRDDEAEAFITEWSETESQERKLGREVVKDLKLDLADLPGDVIGQKIGRYKILERVGAHSHPSCRAASAMSIAAPSREERFLWD